MRRVFVVFLVAFTIPHFLFLSRFPAGINHDEAEVILSAKSFWETGKDYSGVFFPLSLFRSQTQAGIASLPSFILSPFVGLFPQNIFFYRLYFVVINLLTIYVFSKIVFELTKNKLLSQIIFLLSLISPWLFYYSRATTEAPFALLFSLLGIYFIVKTKANLYYSALFFILSFFSYYGAKPIIPVLAVFSYLIFYQKKSYKKNILYLFFILLPLAMTFVMPSRSGELIFSDFSQYSQTTNEIRRTMIYTPINQVVFNKYYFLLWDIFQKIFSLYNPNILFLGGDPRATYNFEWHGLLYLIDFPLIIAGIYALAKKKYKKLRELVIVLFIVSPISVALSTIEISIVYRAFLFPVILITLSALAITELAKFSKFILFLCLVFYINFLYIFFIVNPVRQQENNYYSEKVLAEYVTRENNTTTIAVADPYKVYLMFDLYKVDKDYNVIDTCPQTLEDGVLIVQSNMKCKFETDSFATIQHQRDSGGIYTIYNSKLCSGVELFAYRREHRLNDYYFSNMNDQQFCDRWIQK